MSKQHRITLVVMWIVIAALLVTSVILLGISLRGILVAVVESVFGPWTGEASEGVGTFELEIQPQHKSMLVGGAVCMALAMVLLLVVNQLSKAFKAEARKKQDDDIQAYQLLRSMGMTQNAQADDETPPPAEGAAEGAKRYCVHCGKPIHREDYRYCPYCGQDAVPVDSELAALSVPIDVSDVLVPEEEAPRTPARRTTCMYCGKKLEPDEETCSLCGHKVRFE